MAPRHLKIMDFLHRKAFELRHGGLVERLSSYGPRNLPKERLKEGSGFYKLLANPPLVLKMRRPGNAIGPQEQARLHSLVFAEHQKIAKPKLYLLRKIRIHLASPEYYVREFVDRPTIESLTNPKSARRPLAAPTEKFLLENPGFSKVALGKAYAEWYSNMQAVSEKTGVLLALNQEDVFVDSLNPKTGKFTFIMRDIILPRAER